MTIFKRPMPAGKNFTSIDICGFEIEADAHGFAVFQ
jgi:hypothetical protein